eukprot:4463091-Prymnesium_polylepis.2
MGGRVSAGPCAADARAAIAAHGAGAGARGRASIGVRVQQLIQFSELQECLRDRHAIVAPLQRV